MKTEVGQRWFRNKRHDKWKTAIEIIHCGAIVTIWSNRSTQVDFVLDGMPKAIWANVPKEVFFTYFDLLEPMEEA